MKSPVIYKSELLTKISNVLDQSDVAEDFEDYIASLNESELSRVEMIKDIMKQVVQKKYNIPQKIYRFNKELSTILRLIELSGLDLIEKEIPAKATLVTKDNVYVITESVSESKKIRKMFPNTIHIKGTDADAIVKKVISIAKRQEQDAADAMMSND
jgi:hypothetical protein